MTLASWGWLIIIVVLLSPVILILLLIFLMVVSVWLESLSIKVQRMQYRLDAWQHNKKAKALRLARDDWQGLPLPKGKHGELRITQALLVQFPFSYRQIEKVMFDRAKDLGVYMLIELDQKDHSYLVTWRKHKK